MDRLASRLEARAGTGAPQPPGGRMAVVMVCWDMERSLVGWDRLATALRRLEGWHVDACLVDNRRTGGGVTDGPHGATVIAGDNSAREFSGYAAGHRYLGARVAAGAATPDVWLFVNDRYDAYHDPLRHLTAGALVTALELDALSGHVDAYPAPVHSFGTDLSSWVATSLVVVPATLLQRLESVLSLTAQQLGGVLHDDYQPQRSPFRDGGPVEAEYATYLVDWLTDSARPTLLSMTWYRQMTLSPQTWGEFRAKVLSILNEQLLSARSRALGSPVVSLNLLDRLATLPSGSRSVRAAVHAVRTDPGAALRLDRPWPRLRLAAAALAHRRIRR